MWCTENQFVSLLDPKHLN